MGLKYNRRLVAGSALALLLALTGAARAEDKPAAAPPVTVISGRNPPAIRPCASRLTVTAVVPVAVPVMVSVSARAVAVLASRNICPPPV